MAILSILGAQEFWKTPGVSPEEVRCPLTQDANHTSSTQLSKEEAGRLLCCPVMSQHGRVARRLFFRRSGGGELARLTWADLDLEAAVPRINVRTREPYSHRK
jgi:hypothetical protein